MGGQTVIDLAKKGPRSFDKASDQKHTFQVKRHEGFVLEMEDVLFHFDSAVMMPDYELDPEEFEDSPPYRISGLAVLRACYLHASKYPSHKVLVTGHTDLTGTEAYNLNLSRLRADNVLHALTGNRDAWVQTALKKHQVEDYQQILKWVNRTWQWNCDPGEIDNLLGPITKGAVYAFQVAYNKHFKASIAEDGVVGKETWGAFFDVYMDELAGLMETDQAGLKKYRDALKFFKEECKAAGCGKFFPVSQGRKNRSPGEHPLGSEEDEKSADKYRSELSRRVEILFFDSAHEPPLDCHPDPDTCLPDQCVINRASVYRFQHIVVEPAPHLIWLDLQTVDEFGFKVPKVDLTLAPEFGKTVKISTDEDGYWSGRIRADGMIRVLLADGKTPAYFAGGQGTEEEKKPAVLDPRIAATAVTDLVVPGTISDEDRARRLALTRRFGRLPSKGHQTIRGANTGPDEGEDVGQMPQRGKEAAPGELPRLYRRSFGYLVTDNLFIAAGFEAKAGTDCDQLVGLIADWLRVYHPTAVKRGYFLELMIGNGLVVCSADGSKVLGQYSIKPDYSINPCFGAYTPFECFGRIFRDMNTETVDFIVKPTGEGADTQDESASQDLLQGGPQTTSEDKIIPIDEILVDKDREAYRKLVLGELAGKTEVLYLLPGGLAPLLARHGGTGLMENYSSGLSGSERKKLHQRNLSVAKNCRIAYESYIRKYVDDVKKTKTDEELHKMGPPDSHFIFPEPIGISEAEKRELREAQATPDEFLAWKAVAQHLCELYGVHGDGDMWLKIEIELDSGQNLGKIIDIRYKWNFETTAEGHLKKKSSQFGLAGKGQKEIGGTTYKAGLTEWINEEGVTETKAQFSAGAYSFEYNITTGEAKAGVFPFFVKANEEIKQIGFGAQVSTRDLLKMFRQAQIAKGVPADKCLDPDKYPSAKFALGLQMQLLQEATVMAYLMGTRGFFERRPISELLKADWASLDYDEHRFLEVLGWHTEIGSLPDLQFLSKYYPANTRLWDARRLLPYDNYPKSVRTKWGDLTYAEKQASLNLLGAQWASEANWLKFWQSFMPKVTQKK